MYLNLILSLSVGSLRICFSTAYQVPTSYLAQSPPKIENIDTHGVENNLDLKIGVAGSFQKPGGMRHEWSVLGAKHQEGKSHQDKKRECFHRVDLVINYKGKDEDSTYLRQQKSYNSKEKHLES